MPTTSVAWGGVTENPTAGGDGGASVSGAGAVKNQDESTEDGSWAPFPCSNRGERRGEKCPLSQEPMLPQRGWFMAEVSERAPYPPIWHAKCWRRCFVLRQGTLEEVRTLGARGNSRTSRETWYGSSRSTAMGDTGVYPGSGHLAV